MKSLSFALSALSILALSAALPLGCSDGEDIPIGSNNQEISCNADSDCPNGDVCSNGVCDDPSGCQPVAESCDGVDNDCDGAVDNGATCALGLACVNGSCQGNQCQPAAEACNGLDDDCDGTVDDNATCADPALACVNGSCQNCAFGGCATPCATDSDCPPAETCQNGFCGPGANCVPEDCNGLDDDCNGIVDDFICADGSQCINGVCGGGGGGCDPANPMPQPETCNGLDDDCDGVVDNGSPLCNGFAEQCMNGDCVICSGGACSNPCSADSDCDPGETCLNGACSP